MIPAMRLAGEQCRACDEDALYWYWKDETEVVLEVIVECDACGFGYPKRVVDKQKNTRQDALEALAREVVA
jgi:Zn ribbon nucleic-acid-binding protein